MISVRPYNQDTDYELFAQWWKDHNFDAVPPVALPALGVVTEYNGKPVAAAWLYLDTSTPIGMLEWIVTDPANKPKVSAIGISHAVQALRYSAMELGHTIILSSCRQQSLAHLLERLGFTETDKQVIHLISVIQPEPTPEP